MRKLIFSITLLFGIHYLLAQPVNEDLPQITGTIALTNARVITAPGKAPVVQTLILRNGLIQSMGPGIKVPPDAYKIAADSLYVYPAFIDAFSSIGIKEPENQAGRRGPGGSGGDDTQPAMDEEGNVSLEEAGITPFQHTRATFDAKEKSISDWRAQGFAIAHVVPRGRMIPGQGAIVILSGKNADQMLWKEDVSFLGQWAGAGNHYPGTVIAVMAKWRELSQNATQEVMHQTSYNANSMVPRPQYNQAHEALIPLVKKEMPLYFKAVGVKDISRALSLQKDLGMRMVIADAQEAYYLKDQFKTNGIPLILSLDLPEDKSEQKKEGEDKKGKEEKNDSIKVDSIKKIKTDTIAKDPEKIAFEARRMESLKAHQDQAGTLVKEGIPFSFGTMSGKSGDFYKTMQTLAEHGLDSNSALNALTLQPAKLLGIDKYCGTIAPGKMANLIVSNKPIFQKEANIRYMIVEGAVYEYEIKEKKKASGKSDPEITTTLTGTWSYTIEAPDQKRQGTFEFSPEGTDWKGTITSAEITSGNSALKDIVVDGNKVSFTFDLDMGGQEVELEFDLTIDKETFDGTVKVGEFGSFPINGNKSSKPNQ